MRNSKKRVPGGWLILSVLFIVTVQCSTNEDALYKRLRKYADEIRVIDTHEHHRLPAEYGDYKFGFYQQLYFSYLREDLVSAGADMLDLNQLDTMSNDELWGKYGEALNYCRNTSYYDYVMKGFRKLYGFSDPYFTKENVPALSARLEEKYKDYNSWFEQAFQESGFELMFLDRSWRSWHLFKSDDTGKQHFALVLHADQLITEVAKKPSGTEPGLFYSEAVKEGYAFKDLDDYLTYCDHLIKKNIVENKVVCIKNLLTYSRTLFYEDVSYEEACDLFAGKSDQLNPSEVKKLEDYMFSWIIGKATEYDLPVQIHTGYFADNGNTLENGYPLKLNNLFLKYPDAKFILFHGSFPWTGEFTALGKMFPNVYLDLVWLPQISREEAVNSLDVMLDCVPYNKFFWGGDCKFIEGSAGALELGKDVVAEVLARRMKRGVLTEDEAKEIIDGIFRQNAVRVFNLSEKLGREF
jgi:hypothetical protein